MKKYPTPKGYHPVHYDMLAFAVGRLRLAHEWRQFNAHDNMIMEGHLPVLELANLLDVSLSWLNGRILRGSILCDFINDHPEYDKLFVCHDPKLLVTQRDMKKNVRQHGLFLDQRLYCKLKEL